ncbi:ribokinase [Beutenbergia cavernae DSM 12333]|uniref:Deoxyribokinase n=1 Tax=Beutenbergia cavernae (strain ATCC BAA-8 / DSM 12333 / CCUG 43141 / JCM 11478 / NBRC 16432 / NCIMB 13614 / HKI 0122) TaxID=471853 RepID=C5C448_BEUC1|nr:ribokinase [Beutenbergia cavernae]ACQ79961.1 ribokinase [Beutenbergia cavernae DSM 12333]
MSASRGRVCVVGSFMMDLVVSAPRRPRPGETLVGTSFAQYVGGKGFNQAVAASRAGAATSFVGRLGDDLFGAEFRAALRTDGIDDGGVLDDAEGGTGVGLPVVEPGGQNSIIIVPRANLRLTPADVERSRERIEAADVLLLQLEVPVEASLAAARIARGAGTAVVLNPAPYAPLPPELVAACDLLVPNEHELAGLAGAPVPADGPEAVEVLARDVLGRHGVSLVVTMGATGVLVLAADGASSLVPGRTVEAVDTVGAGDTFCGNLGARLAVGDALTDAVAYANAAASIAVTRHGGAPSAPEADEVEAVRRHLEIAG